MSGKSTIIDATSLSSFITQLKHYEPFGSRPRPNALSFIIDFQRFITCLENINNMIGLSSVKDQIVEQMKSFIVNYRRFGKPTNGEKLHTLLFGSPGCGKTELGRNLAELWAVSGCLPSSNGSKSPSTDLEKTSLRQTLSFRESQIRLYQEKTKADRLIMSETLTLFNNVRKKIKAKQPDQEMYIQAKLQEIKTKIKDLAGILPNDSSQILPVTVPKIPGIRSLFGSSHPPILPQITDSSTTHIAKFTVLTRGDLIGKYQGHTTDQIRKVLNEHIGGVVMIDEAYNMCTSGQDDFGREALTEIIHFMTTWPDKIIFIFAGYRNEMEATIFKFQPGLARRFNWTFEIDEYSGEELYMIFRQQLKRNSWELDNDAIIETKKFFVDNRDKFPFFGGDTERMCKFVEEACNENNWLMALDNTVLDDEYDKQFSDIKFDSIKRAFEKYLRNSVREGEEKHKQNELDLIRLLYI